MTSEPRSFKIDFGNGIVWEAQPKQLDFLYLDVDEALYGGAAGGGKSDTLLALSIARRYAAPGSKGLILRRTLAELQKEGSLIPRSLELLSNAPGWKWNDQKKKWTYRHDKFTQSVLEFGYCDHEKDVYKYQSAQYEDISLDEATHFTASMVEYFKTRNRSRRGFRPIMRYATNPGNVGHAYFKANFVDAGPWGKVIKVPDPFKPGAYITRCFIHAKLEHNMKLMEADPLYESRLNMIPDEHLRRALRDGDWDIFAGQYFAEWRRQLHVVKPFEIPAHWNRFICMDWGKEKPLAVYWIAVNEIGRAYVYRELYATGYIASEAARKIVEMSKPDFPGVPEKQIMGRYRFFAIDPSVYASKGEGTESIGSTMQKVFGRPMMKAKNQRVNGWMRVHEWFALNPDDGLPWMQFFETCTHAIRTIPLLIHDETIPEDVNTEGEDHAGDAIRYFAVTRPAPSRRIAPDPLSKLSLADQARWERFNQDPAIQKRSPDKAVQDFLDGVSL